jgi:fumarate reductase subunit D
MALEIGESGQFQLDFAVTKIVTVLIFAIFCPLGIVGANQSSPNSWERANRQQYLVCG